MNMIANELRIGNKLLWLSTVVDVDIDVLISITDNNEDAELYKPISLTPEILEKCDIKHFPSELFWNGNDYHIAFENGEWLFIKYFHQLQNIYFALTGEELKIQL